MTLGHPKPPVAERKPRAPLPRNTKPIARKKPAPLSAAEKRKRSLRRNLKPLKRSSAPKRKKNVLVSRYLHPAWKKLRLKVLRRDRNRCRLGHPGCLGRASQVHHTRYNKGRGVKRLLVELEYLLSVCGPCHRVEDPWLGRGFGRGSREKNQRAGSPVLPTQVHTTATNFVDFTSA